jgi:hypothetical protein
MYRKNSYMYISLLYRKITRLDPSPPFANAVEQVEW